MGYVRRVKVDPTRFSSAKLAKSHDPFSKDTSSYQSHVLVTVLGVFRFSPHARQGHTGTFKNYQLLACKADDLAQWDPHITRDIHRSTSSSGTHYL